MTMNLEEMKSKLNEDVGNWERRLQELLVETRYAEAKLSEARGGLLVISKLEAEQVPLSSKRNAESLLQIPAVKLVDAVRKATVALKRFTRDDLEEWIRSNYPQLQFSKKSVDGPIRELMADGAVVILRRNTGNKIPAVYGLKESSVTDTNAK
jgi:hypothetical protein